MVKKNCNMFKEEYGWRMWLEEYNEKIIEMINGQRGTSEQIMAKWMTRIKHLEWKVTTI